MSLRCIIETKFVPSVLVHYEKHSDNESSDERKINFYEYMSLRCIIETKFVPSVLVHYEKHSDNESSDERKINVQQIFVCIINHIGKTLYVFSIYTSFLV